MHDVTSSGSDSYMGSARPSMNVASHESCPSTCGVFSTYQGIGQPGLAPFKLWVDLNDQFAFLGPVVRVMLDDAIDVSERSGCITAIVLRRGTYRDRTEAEVHPQPERPAGKVMDEVTQTANEKPIHTALWTCRTSHHSLRCQCRQFLHVAFLVV